MAGGRGGRAGGRWRPRPVGPLPRRPRSAPPAGVRAPLPPPARRARRHLAARGRLAAAAASSLARGPGRGPDVGGGAGGGVCVWGGGGRWGGRPGAGRALRQRGQAAGRPPRWATPAPGRHLHVDSGGCWARGSASGGFLLGMLRACGELAGKRGPSQLPSRGDRIRLCRSPYLVLKSGTVPSTEPVRCVAVLVLKSNPSL